MKEKLEALLRDGIPRINAAKTEAELQEIKGSLLGKQGSVTLLMKEMSKLLDYPGAGHLDNLCVGAGDLYVTVYGGRTRLVGILLGRGLDIDQAKAELNGVTLESLVVAVRVSRAIRAAAALGKLDIKDFPLLTHVDAILSEKAEVNIPWEAFTFER